MGKCRAEIQRAYRERKKAKEGRNYLKKETERVKSYYKPTTEIGPNKLKTRRERVRKCMQRLRQNQKEVNNNELSRAGEEDNIIQNQEAINDEQSPGPCDSTTMNLMPSTSYREQNQKMVVNMKFAEKRGSWKNKHCVKKANSKIQELESRLSALKKRNNTLRKRLQRANAQSQQTPKSKELNAKVVVNSSSTTKSDRKRKLPENELNTPMTPRSKSVDLLRSEGLTPKKHPKLIKQLTFHNSIVEEVKRNIAPNRGRARQRTALQIVCGKVIKRYRMTSNSSRALGVNRGQINKAGTGTLIQKRRKAFQKLQTSENVKRFLERDDNSTCLPGKRDKLKTKSGMTQTRVLNDYLYNLHLKFKSENPHMKIGFTSFCSYRPKHVKLVQFSARRTCLCQKHQNMSLKVKGLKSVGVSTTENPDTLISNNSDEEIIQKLRDCPSDTIKYTQWKRKEVEHKGRMTKRMMIANLEMPKNEFIDLFTHDLSEFRKHTERVKTQYVQITALKEKMPRDHVLCQMDFAENYSCGHADEIQNAYFDKCSVTLHPVVVYFKDAEGKIGHTSYVYVSDTPSHNSGTVYSFMKKICEEVKANRPNTNCIHYVTDSPTSQYRNKSIMYLVANHDKIFGMKASWQYWEAGHGKGPCDGVGGTSKRLADLAVKRQVAVIQSAEDYFHWGETIDKSQIKYVFVPKIGCDQAQLELSAWNIKPIKGTLEIHSVVQLKTAEIAQKHIMRLRTLFC
jgi:hypothetical protein